ncbi:unnamed protein product [Merluccius merluccius]
MTSSWSRWLVQPAGPDGDGLSPSCCTDTTRTEEEHISRQLNERSSVIVEEEEEEEEDQLQKGIPYKVDFIMKRHLEHWAWCGCGSRCERWRGVRGKECRGKVCVRNTPPPPPSPPLTFLPLPPRLRITFATTSPSSAVTFLTSPPFTLISPPAPPSPPVAAPHLPSDLSVTSDLHPTPAPDLSVTSPHPPVTSALPRHFAGEFRVHSPARTSIWLSDVPRADASPGTEPQPPAGLSPWAEAGGGGGGRGVGFPSMAVPVAVVEHGGPPRADVIFPDAEDC